MILKWPTENSISGFILILGILLYQTNHRNQIVTQPATIKFIKNILAFQNANFNESCSDGDSITKTVNLSTQFNRIFHKEAH